MKNLILISWVIVLLLCPALVKAVPAYPYPVKVTQPDGSSVVIRMHGDEFMNRMSTEDGYTVVLNEDGYYVYADLKNGSLVPTSYVAKDAAYRSVDEQSYLSKVGKNIVAADNAKATALRVAANAGYGEDGLMTRANASGLDNYRGLVILVEYNDRGFTRDDLNTLFTDMMNKRNYTGYDDNGKHIEYTGSVRDYFYENSEGKFDPEFDVVGPVKIDYSQTYVNQTSNATTIMKAACRAADPLVDFSKYDSDGDGKVDMVYFIFAGAGSNVGGNNSKYLWPHAFSFSQFKLDGIYLGRYACSTELYGLEKEKMLDGIGTICHEFSHVLGLPDLYDTDYDSSGGETNHPGIWSIMSGGSYSNYGRTPTGYTIYEKYASGWVMPKLIDGEGNHSLKPQNSAHEGYRINSAVNKEFFLIENRQLEGWDRFLPGHGMLVYRVDSTSTYAWVNNAVNINPSHQYFELVRATPGGTDSPTDPYPGKNKITYLTGSGALASWKGSETPISIFDIKESEGLISFKTGDFAEQVYLEDFEGMDVTDQNATDIEGVFSNWNLKQAFIQEPGSALAHGNRSIGMLQKAQLTSTTPVDIEVKTASFMFWNPTKVTAQVRLQYSTGGGKIWTTAKTESGETLATVAPGKSALLKYNINLDVPSLYQVVLYKGSNTEKCYLDDFTLTYVSKINTGISQEFAEDMSWKVYCNDGKIIIETGEDISSDVWIYSASGVLVENAKLQSGRAEISLQEKGLYIINCNGKIAKVIY